MIFPLRTDAPIYHYPIGTVLLIVICIGVHALRYMLDIPTETFALPLGDGITPLAWITSNFIHMDLSHLIGNVWFLWIFGIVVEGKVGFFRFILIALCIGAGESAIEQLLFLNHFPTYSAGASVIIYGLMTMVLIWAPENRFECVWFIYWAYHVEFELSHYTFAVIYIGLNILGVFTSHFEISSSLLHLGGVIMALPIAILMLYWGWVNCEGYDLFTRYGHLVNLPEAYLPMTPTNESHSIDVELGEELIQPTKKPATKSFAAGSENVA